MAINGRTVTNKLPAGTPRFFINMNQNLLQDEEIRDIYLYNVASVDGLDVNETNIPVIRRLVKKLLTLSQTQKFVTFVPVAEALEMRVGFQFSSDKYVLNNRWMGLLGHNLYTFGGMADYDTDVDPEGAWTKMAFCSRAVEDWEAGASAETNWIDKMDPHGGEGFYFQAADKNPYDGNDLDIIANSGGGSVDTASGYALPGKNGTSMYSYAYQATQWNFTMPDDWDIEDENGNYDYIWDYGTESAKHNCVYLKIEFNSDAWGDDGGHSLGVREGGGSGGKFALANFMLGDTWIAPHPVDLNTNFTQEFDGVTTRRGVNGTSISNIRYRTPPGFGRQDHWINYSNPNHLRQRMGRRRWSINLSYLSEHHLLGSPEGSLDNWNDSYVLIAERQNFFNRVANYTLGSHFPFIFQPNLYSHNLSIARFDQDKFSVEQSGPNLWTLPLEIVESW